MLRNSVFNYAEVAAGIENRSTLVRIAIDDSQSVDSCGHATVNMEYASRWLPLIVIPPAGATIVVRLAAPGLRDFELTKVPSGQRLRGQAAIKAKRISAWKAICKGDCLA